MADSDFSDKEAHYSSDPSRKRGGWITLPFMLVGNSRRLMSVIWLFPALVIVGIGEAFHFPTSIAIFYGEFPESLRNTATSLTSLVMGISFYLCTALIDMIQRTTKWLPNDINHGRVDNVYWVLVILGRHVN
ncbi:hypothetical protein ARALYDRAFT_905734 [Arabidopsis lyrata subsp. lyrata]|uniref:Uncharacterized protein n=1 Tax=Arabidopsis lyrata subsp. lyrata TaxID=81972 RepID=D7LMQ8_ARALL|nr:hypothetical protein ARALYDRAFT_905734 [Arabidopsis lyrata subsp. lyrata]